jgi:hypothetical protein
MVYRLRLFAGDVDPGFEDFKDKDVVLRYKPCIDYPAVEIRITFCDERRSHARGRQWRQGKSFELVGAPARSVSAATALVASFTVGMLITHSFVDLSMSNEKYRLLITHPTIGGSNSIIVCHDRLFVGCGEIDRNLDPTAFTPVCGVLCPIVTVHACHIVAS